MALFPIPSFEEGRQLLIAAFSGRFPNKNVNKGSGLYKRLSVAALGIADLHYHLRQILLDIMPDTSTGTMLRRWLKIWGVPEKGATGAAKSSALRVFGAVASPVPAGEAMTHVASGLVFETRSAGVIPAAGFLDVDVAAISTGAKTNLEVGEELQFQAAPAGLKANARIVVELENGKDIETEPDMLDRLLNRIGQPKAGGNKNDFEQWTIEAANFVATAYVYPNRNGKGSVDVVGLKTGTGSARLLSASERLEIFDYIDPKRFVTATPRSIEVTTSDTDVEIVISPKKRQRTSDPTYAFDWNDAAVPVLAAYTSATRLVELSAARPVDMEAGDRVVFADPLLGGEQWVIESLSGTDDFVITEDAGAIAAGNVYSGGPLTDAIRAAGQKLIDDLGPANPDAHRYGEWEANLRHSNLFGTVQTQTGVLDSQIILPAAALLEASDPTWPLNTTVELLVARSIIVRSYASEGL